MENNKLTGDIPACLFNIKGLKYLFLGGNNLIWNNNTKIVPKFMFYGLSMKSCGLVGQIPYCISTQKTLVSLDLSENHLEGMFPLWLAEMNLFYLILLDNNLKGSLPPSLFNNTKLQVLSLSRNNFYGELPSNIGNASLMVLGLFSLAHEESPSNKAQNPSHCFLLTCDTRVLVYTRFWAATNT